MRKTDTDPKVIQLARDLRIPARGKVSDRIRDYALGWVRSALSTWPLPIKTIQDLQCFLRARLSVVLEVIESDYDLERIAREYRFSEAQRRRFYLEFNREDVEGWLIPYPDRKPGDRNHLAIADARGARSSRAFFTGWHEIVHIILTPEQLVLEGMRRSILVNRQKDAVESVVDDITGHLAFFEPIVRPVLEREIAEAGRLTFEVIESVRQEVAPTASFYSAAIACARLTPEPTLFLQVAWAYKQSEQRSLRNQQSELMLGSIPTVLPKMRVTDDVPNDAARGSSGLRIFSPMRVPEKSAIYDVAVNGVERAFAYENQDEWEASGRMLPALPICVEAIRRGRYVYGLIIAR
jgi:hypothetical protein